jgi:hypothetical protein
MELDLCKADCLAWQLERLGLINELLDLLKNFSRLVEGDLTLHASTIG